MTVPVPDARKVLYLLAGCLTGCEIVSSGIKTRNALVNLNVNGHVLELRLLGSIDVNFTIGEYGDQNSTTGDVGKSDIEPVQN